MPDPDTRSLRSLVRDDISGTGAMSNDKEDPREWKLLRPSTQRDHRTLFTLAELEAAYRKVLPEADALWAAEETMSGTIVPGQPALFTDDVLRLLSEVSPDVALRVRIAQGHVI
jgi:hypothetical protein